MCDNGPFGHRVGFGGNIRVNASDYLSWSRRAFTHRLQNVGFTLLPVRDVFINLSERVSHRRAVTAEEHREMWQRAQTLKRREVRAHVAFGRVDQNRA